MMKQKDSLICLNCGCRKFQFDDLWSYQDEMDMGEFLSDYGLPITMYCKCNYIRQEIKLNTCFNWLTTSIPLDINNC